MKEPRKNPWTADRLAQLVTDQVESIRTNALRLNVSDLVALCDAELVKRAPTRHKKTGPTQDQHSDADVITGYHFVCANDLGVTPASDGRFWSGSWVVAEHNVVRSLRYGAYLALHESKSSPSYRQGTILDFRRSARGMVSKRTEGIEFLVSSTSEPLLWVGAGSGEKGYKWSTAVEADAARERGSHGS